MSHIFFSLTLVLYGCATITYLAYLSRTTPTLATWANRLVMAGFAAHSLATIHRFSSAGHLPITNMHESLSFFGLAIVGTFILFERRYRVAILGSFIIPLALLFVIASSAFPTAIRDLNPALRSGWLWVHTIMAFIAYATFTIAFGAAVIYLIQQHFLKKKRLGALFQKLPSLNTLDDINYRCLTVGFPLLTVAIITGAIWAEKAWGTYWSWDPKETWSLITWFIFAALLHGRMTTGWRGRRAALLSIAGFLIMLFTFIGVNLWLPGLHSYK
ncbi:MAG: c-type cytochrome biogenesis protein CcsB [Deltaproteobacteria bacterium]|nr:c-type cytochrome biogenesis protein CcsB [Deltaproteobacteria bacterium]